LAKIFKFITEGAKKAFNDLPKEIQIQFAADLNAVANNLRPYSKIKNLAESVGKGAIELIENGSPAFRTVYCAKYNNTIYILHAFTKTTNGVDRKAMKTAKARYKTMLADIKAGEDKARLETKEIISSLIGPSNNVEA